jgi:hypothetical protein
MGNTASSLKYCVVQYGGSYGYNYNDPGMISLASPSSVTISNCTFSNAGTCVLFVPQGASFGSFDYNTISVDNTSDGVNIPANLVSSLGLNNTITARREIVISGSTFTLPSATWPRQNYPYYIDGLITISAQNANGAWLTLTSGTEFRMSTPNSGLIVGDEYSASFNGGLIAVGTAASPIKFTSAKSPASPGDWGTIEFGMTAMSGTKLQYATVEYGGNSLGAIYVAKNNLPVISNCAINNSKTWGIVNNQCTPTLTNNTFSNNASGNINNTSF